VRQRVKDLGEYSPSADLYSLLSDPVHVTPWSTHMYSYELLEQPGGYSVQYAPQYNPFRALICAHLINMTLPHLSGYFVAFCEQHYAGDARFDDLASRQDRMIRNYDSQSLKTRVLLDWIARAQQRLRDGDAFDEVFSAPPSASCH
jgi:hypothetical protein